MAAGKGQPSGSSVKQLRIVLVGILLYTWVPKFYRFFNILPWGAPVKWDDRNKFAPVDYSTRELLQFQHGRTKLIYGRGEDKGLIQGPETAVMNPKDGTMYLLTNEGNLLSMTDLRHNNSKHIMTGQVNFVRDVGNGRPLSGKFASNGKTLYMSDAVMGLTRISDIFNPRSKVEIVASSVRDEDGAGGSRVSPLRYVNALCIGKSNKVYFTDSTEIRPDSYGQNTPDTMYSSKMDLIRAIGTGRLLEYDPSTDQTRVLRRGLRFSNGIAVNDKETYLVFAETFGPRIWKYNLDDGTSEILVDNHELMGYPDGLDCDGSSGKCYAVIPSSVVPIHKLLATLPHFMDIALRYVLMSVPRQLAPPIKKFGGVLEFDPETNMDENTEQERFRYLLDAKGRDVSTLCGSTVFRKQLYLGSLHNDYIGVFDLSTE
eukprot:CAMPEP_0168755664 /NCGR_PEP_ID=MMETSP0724-20121128/20192_1 /TAXON_ID=265536 /ORGANISM="Amphiprora sp., Strain CCMP467" /LENGTH=428 /DNA_ID=CAMNT_0008804299 /DNA_START=269 /DNA_END=1552 /DNA_ORIENTATION=-